jgi:DNA-binding GntR family transcriptional regulator
MQRLEHRTKTELALEGLRYAILRGELGAGRRMTLIDLQQALGMSSTPIREAIRVLEAEGLVTNEPHRGVTVASLTLDRVAELYMLRAPLERLSGQLAARNITGDELGRLEELQVPFEEAARAQDDERMTQINADFHTLIYAATQTQYLEKFVLRLWVPYNWGARWSLTGRGESVKEHAQITKALKKRDPELAGERLERHTLRVYEVLRREVERAGEGSAASGAAAS